MLAAWRPTIKTPMGMCDVSGRSQKSRQWSLYSLAGALSAWGFVDGFQGKGSRIDPLKQSDSLSVIEMATLARSHDVEWLTGRQKKRKTQPISSDLAGCLCLNRQSLAGRLVF